jgi:hypothetical protein
MSTSKVVEVKDPSPVIDTVKVEIRGRRYTFRELTISEYDKLIKQATREEPDADGDMQEITDSSLLLRLMILKSCVDPKITPDDLNDFGSKVYRALSSVVNELHYAAEPIKQIKDDDETLAESDEETPKGNE